MWGDMGRYGEIWGDVAEHTSLGDHARSATAAARGHARLTKLVASMNSDQKHACTHTRYAIELVCRRRAMVGGVGSKAVC